MAKKLANRMVDAKPSFTRETLKYSVDPSVLSFAGGSPNTDLFPAAALQASSEAVLGQQWRSALQYSITEGYIPLRRQLQERMKAVGVDAGLDEIIITTGSQQGLDLSAKIYIDPGDVILVESPTYLGALNAFRYYEPTFVDVDMDEEGMRMDALEARLREYPNTRFIYTIPDFQNPTGRVLSEARRRRMVELAEEYDVLIVEDNPYYDLRFEGDPIPPVKHFDRYDRVIYLGSMSKILSPGMRVGWIVAPKAIIGDYVLLKQASDLSTTEVAQQMVSHYLGNQDFDAHLALLNQEYKKRRDVMLDAFHRYFPEGIQATEPKGGLFLWLTLPEGCNCMEIFYEALETEKVIFVPGETCFPDGGHNNTLRLCYSTTSEEKIEDGMRRLARVFDAVLSRNCSHALAQ